MSTGRTHRITVDPAGLDAPSPAPVDRIVERQHHGTAWNEGLEEQPKQDGDC